MLFLTPLITAPYLARVLGKEGIGIYAYTYSVAWYFVLFAKLGIDTYGSRAIALVRDNSKELNQTFSELFFIHVVMSIIVLCAYFVYLQCIKELSIVEVMQGLYIVAEMIEINWLFIGLEKFKLIVRRSIFIKISTIMAIFIFVKSSEDVWKYCVILSGTALLSEAIIWTKLPNEIGLRKISIKAAIRHIKPLFAFFVPSIAVSLYKIMDKIMLGKLAGIEQVGLYESSERVISILQGFVTALGTVMLPRISNLIAIGEETKSKKIITLSMKYIMIITFPLIFGIVGIADKFVFVFYGKDFSECIYLIQGLAVSMAFLAFANVIRTQYLLPNGKDIVYQASLISGAIVNVITNSLLIPQIRALGTVIGTILAEATVCIIQSVCSRKQLPVTLYIKRSIPYLLNGLIMCIVVYITGLNKEANVSTLTVQIVIGVLVYTTLSFIHLITVKDELWQEIKNTIKKGIR